MKSSSLIKPRTLATMLCAVAMTGGFVAYRAQADEWNKKTILTVDQPIQVTHTVLQPGKYVFRLLDSNSDRHIVQIFDGDQTHVIDTILAIPNYRLQPTGKSQFTFWETPPGTARALRAWFYPGDNFGQEFPYPKQLAMLEVPATAPAPAPPVVTPEPVPQPAPPPAPAPQTMTQPPTPREPVQIAQSAPPPAPEPPPPPPQQPETLPKTGSSYPMIGLGGLLSLCGYGLLRMKRVA
jgi:LPXTG-motif cell wall-anchored protein